MAKIAPESGPEKPETLVARFNAEMARMADDFPTPTGPRPFVDLGTVLLWMDKAIKEAWNQGCVAGLGRQPARIELKVGANDSEFSRWVTDKVRTMLPPDAGEVAKP